MGFFDFITGNKRGISVKAEKDVIGSSADNPYMERGDDDEFKAYIPNFLYKPPFGYPLNKNVLMLKELARNPFIFSVIRTLKDEASTSDFKIVLKDEFADGVVDTDFDDKKKRVLRFFDCPNGNAESFGEIIGQWVQDLCETDAAVGVKVFNRNGDFSQLFARDGSSFLKNPDIYGYMGNRDDFVSPMSEMNPNLVMPEKIKIYGAHYSASAAYFQYGWTGNALPVPFGKREVMYIMGNPRTDSIYGRSPLEIIQDVLLTLVYGVRYNLDYFLNGNMPDGIVNLVGADKEVAKSFQDRLREKFTAPDSLGNKNVRKGHVYPVWGGPEVNFVPFQVSSKDMEIIESQKWFTKLVWSAFGVTPEEMGYSEDSNKAVSQTMTGVHKRKALKPLLRKIEFVINSQLMPELDPSGFFEFRFEDYDLDDDLKKHDLYEKQIRMGIKSALMVAEEEGIDVERLKEEKQEDFDMAQNQQGQEEDDDDSGFNKEKDDDGSPVTKAELSVDEIKELANGDDNRLVFELYDTIKVISGSKEHLGRMGKITKVFNNDDEDYYKVQFHDGYDLLFGENMKKIRGLPSADDIVSENIVDDEKPITKSDKDDVDLVDYFKRVKNDLLERSKNDES